MRRFNRKDSVLLKLKYLQAYKRNNCAKLKACREAGVNDETVDRWEKEDTKINIPIDLRDSDDKEVDTRLDKRESIERTDRLDLTCLRNMHKKSFTQALAYIQQDLDNSIHTNLIRNALEPDVKNTLPRIFYLKHCPTFKGRYSDQVYSEDPSPLWFEDKEKPKIKAKVTEVDRGLPSPSKEDPPTIRGGDNVHK